MLNLKQRKQRRRERGVSLIQAGALIIWGKGGGKGGSHAGIAWKKAEELLKRREQALYAGGHSHIDLRCYR